MAHITIILKLGFELDIYFNGLLLLMNIDFCLVSIELGIIGTKQVQLVIGIILFYLMRTLYVISQS